jgi:transcriptional regulator with XRE-family HTH domain
MKQERNISAAKVHPVVARLTEIRLAWQFSQQEIADRIGCRLLTIQKIERGSLWPSFKLLARWADVLGYQISIWPKNV